MCISSAGNTFDGSPAVKDHFYRLAGNRVNESFGEAGPARRTDRSFVACSAHHELLSER